MAEHLLVRHGQTDWSRARLHTGRTDVPLNAEGRAQAERLRAVLADRSFERVLTSPLSRAVETCRLAGFGDRAEPLDDLREWDYGEYEGITTAQIRERRPDWHLWTDGCPGGESPAAVAGRADRVVAQLRAASGGVAVFGHGHLSRMLAARWLGQGPAHGALLALDPATLSELGWERDQAVIRMWNAPAA